MERNRYKDCFVGMEKWYDKKMKLLDKKIENYNGWFMNNTKWKKTFLTIFENLDTVKQCEIVEFTLENYRMRWCNNVKLGKNIEEAKKYLLDDYIHEHLAGGHDPISYREIEYLEFRKYDYQKIGALVTKKEVLQNTNKIKELLSKIGQFYWEETEEYIRIYGYK